MKYFELTKEEKKILKDFESGDLKSVMDKKRKNILEKIAKNTLNKTKNINLRLSERVLARLKTKAAEEGLPYQTLASSVLYKFVSK